MLHQMRAFPDLMSSVSLAKQWAPYCNIFCIYWKGNKRGQRCRQTAFKNCITSARYYCNTWRQICPVHGHRHFRQDRLRLMLCHRNTPQIVQPFLESKTHPVPSWCVTHELSKVTFESDCSTIPPQCSTVKIQQMSGWLKWCESKLPGFLLESWHIQTTKVWDSQWFKFVCLPTLTTQSGDEWEGCKGDTVGMADFEVWSQALVLKINIW